MGEVISQQRVVNRKASGTHHSEEIGLIVRVILKRP
jgi:hypothetical protein